jgi:hypothetical protein
MGRCGKIKEVIMLFDFSKEKVTDTFEKVENKFDMIDSKINNLDNNYYRLSEDIYKKLNKLEVKLAGLYKRDKHGTERPKVDILDDRINKDIEDRFNDMWRFMNELVARIEVLEKAKK